MLFDRAGAEEEFCCYLLVGHAGSEQAEDLKLSLREAFQLTPAFVLSRQNRWACAGGENALRSDQYTDFTSSTRGVDKAAYNVTGLQSLLQNRSELITEV